jgi:hypothetical protein
MMISQYFTAAPYPTHRASQPLPHFPERADARDIRGNRDHLAAVFASRLPRAVGRRSPGNFGSKSGVAKGRAAFRRSGTSM